MGHFISKVFTERSHETIQSRFDSIGRGQASPNKQLFDLNHKKIPMFYFEPSYFQASNQRENKLRSNYFEIKLPVNALIFLSTLYLVNIVNQFVHLLEPRLSILVLKIITHCPHDMVCPCDICLHIIDVYSNCNNVSFSRISPLQLNGSLNCILIRILKTK